jgi:hypothetical protein
MGVKNQAALLWAASTVDAGQVQYIGILDSNVVGAGNMWLYGQLTDAMPIRPGNQPSIQAGDILYYSTGNFSTNFNTAVLNVLRGTTIPGITPYISLYSGDPESGGAELAGGAYARPPIIFNAPAEQPSGQMLIQNSQECMFPAPTGVWGLWAWDGIMDAVSGGNLILKFQNPTPETILKNYIPYWETGAYKIAVN